MANTGENEQALRKIIDFIRLMSIMILLHLYYFCYGLVRHWNLNTDLVDRIVMASKKTGIFANIHFGKVVAYGMLLISLIGAKGRKEENIHVEHSLTILVSGTLLFFAAPLLDMVPMNSLYKMGLYAVVVSAGYILVLSGGTLLSRHIKLQFRKDIFNRKNESFPQEERLLENEYSINLPSSYHYGGRYRRSWINIINPFRSLLVIGTPGAGKSYFVVRHIITQHIAKGFAMFIYDFKYDDLSRIAYNALLKNSGRYPVAPAFYVINFEELNCSHRCNPLDPATMQDITDATESSRTIMLGLNRDWIKKQGDFFVESPINFHRNHLVFAEVSGWKVLHFAPRNRTDAARLSKIVQAVTQRTRNRSLDKSV